MSPLAPTPNWRTAQSYDGIAHVHPTDEPHTLADDCWCGPCEREGVVVHRVRRLAWNDPRVVLRARELCRVDGRACEGPGNHCDGANCDVVALAIGEFEMGRKVS